MRNVNHGRLAICQRTDDLKQVRSFCLGDRRRRFVHDDQIRAVGKSFGDFHHLSTGHAQILQLRSRVDRDLQLLQQCVCIVNHLLVTDPAGRCVGGLPSQEDVLGDGHLRNEAEFLMNHRDSRLQRCTHRREIHGGSLEVNRSCIALMHADQDFHQRRLTRSILAHQRVHAAPTYA